MFGFGFLKTLDQLYRGHNYAPTHWPGLYRKSVAMTDHEGACNKPRHHDETQACDRRLRQMRNGQHRQLDSREKVA